MACTFKGKVHSVAIHINYALTSNIASYNILKRGNVAMKLGLALFFNEAGTS